MYSTSTATTSANAVYWATATLTKTFANELMGDITLYTSSGEAIIEIFGFHIKFTDMQERDISECFYAENWTPLQIENNNNNSNNNSDNNGNNIYNTQWIVFSDGLLGTQIVDMLKRRCVHNPVIITNKGMCIYLCGVCIWRCFNVEVQVCWLYVIVLMYVFRTPHDEA